VTDADIVSGVSTPQPSVPARFAVRASLPVVALGLALLAAPAHADVAEGWSSYEDPSWLHMLALLVGAPAVLFALIALAVYLPALVRGEDVSPRTTEVDDQWFGGRRDGAKELTADEESAAHETGGARGTW
jgi:hypothetical protein